MSTVENRIEYARVVRAIERVQIAIGLLESTRTAASITLGDQRLSVRLADEAILSAKKLVADLEHALIVLGRNL